MNNPNFNHHINHSLSQTLPRIHDKKYYIAVSVSTQHDLSISVSKGRKVIEVIELERFLNNKHSGLGRIPKQDAKHFLAKDLNALNAYKQKVISQLLELKNYFSKKFTDNFEAGIGVQGFLHYLLPPGSYPNLINDFSIDIREIFNAKAWFICSHHLAHACSAFYQSGFRKSLIITYDGGSPDGVLNIFSFSNSRITHLDNLHSHICESYANFGYFLGDINLPKKNYNLEYPGKIMGLSAYGRQKIGLKEFLKRYLHRENDSRQTLEKELFEKFGYDIASCNPKNISSHKRLEQNARQKSLFGQEGYDFAASLQGAFEEKFLELVNPFLYAYSSWPLCLAGGGALNILTNTQVYKEQKKLPFVPPDPSDCGLSLGALLFLIKPDSPYEDPYSGPELLDRNLLSTYINEKYFDTKSDGYLVQNIQGNSSYIAALLKQGKIIGAARGKAERGPRALGNRSILASASIPNMKNKINHKVKGREWFRPFAPVVRLEDVNKYFEWEHESRYMSFSPIVKKKYRRTLESITHVDNTSRVQTVTRDQNKFIYDLLTDLEKECGIGVILNTSFNVDSKPIVSSVKDCLQVLEDTELDGVVIDDILILKTEKAEM